ncbi:MAG: hypothetical protein M3R71_02305 [Actinomycetota bacterium]|nr:hypothetical protein [Actinomycetota bacterium]
MRRSLQEPGCVDGVDQRDVVHASVEVAGLLDLHDALVPPGWGSVLYVPAP